MSLVPYKVAAIIKTDPTGNNVLPGASVSIIKSGGGYAQLWDDEAGTIARGNPFQVDANGERQVWLNGGEYNVSVAGGQSWDIKLVGGADILSIENVAALSTYTPAVGQVYVLKEYHLGTGKGGGQLLAKSGVITPNNVTTFASATAGVYFERINYIIIDASFSGADSSLADNGVYFSRLNSFPDSYTIGAGVFITSVGLEITHVGKKIIGAGSGKTTIKLIDFANLSSNPIIGIGADYSEVSGLKIDGNASNQTSGFYGYLASRVREAVCKDLVITDTFGAPHGFNESSYCRAYDCYVSYARNENPGFFSNKSVGSFYSDGGHEYHNCRATYCDLDGMIANTNNVKVYGGIYNYNGQNVGGGGALGAAGIYTDAVVTGMIITGAECKYNTEFGINLVGGSYHKVTGCDCQFNALSGISFFNVDDGAISRSTSLNNGTNPTVANPGTWGKAGIQFHTCNNLLLSDNHANAGSLQAYGIQWMGTSICNNVTSIGNKLGGVTDYDNFRPGGYYNANIHATLLYRSNSSAIGPVVYKTAVLDPASIAAGASLTISPAFTWIGAQFGDFVDVAAPYNIAGVEVYPYVSSVGNIALILRNSTAAPVDLASGAWTFQVRSKWAS